MFSYFADFFNLETTEKNTLNLLIRYFNNYLFFLIVPHKKLVLET